MTTRRLASSLCLQKATGFAVGLLVLALFGIAGANAAEPAAESQDAIELNIYKQRVKVNATVACRVYERRPIFCMVNLKAPVLAALQAELILKYSDLRIGGKAYEVETTQDQGIKFRADKVNYSGQQQLDVDVIYVK